MQNYFITMETNFTKVAACAILQLLFISYVVRIFPCKKKNINSVSRPVRVRFAPSPTGSMHLGNIRTALINYLFARQKGGTFIVRIEDTDAQRNFDPEARGILDILSWLGLDYDEGPIKRGPFEPYFQSQRSDLYQKKLDELIEKNYVYRCFCTVENLEKKRERQIALRQPPRYDRTCCKLSTQEIEKNLAEQVPFIWRFRVDQSEHVSFNDMGHGDLSFDLSNFSDFPLTRQDGSFTFIFSNCVDDIAMNISHVFRGDDHTSNTVTQALIYKAFGAPLPTFWHLPILCNTEGKKLSKRDFGFAVDDLRKEGYLAEAIANYLAIIGGSYENEIMSLGELVKLFKFDHIASTGLIKYDPEKLLWMNHKWIAGLAIEELLRRCMPLLREVYGNIDQQDHRALSKLVGVIQPNLKTLHDCIPAMQFFFSAPTVSSNMISSHFPELSLNTLTAVIVTNMSAINDHADFVTKLKQSATQEKIPMAIFMRSLRIILTGSPEGPSIHDIIDILGTSETTKRIEAFLA